MPVLKEHLAVQEASRILLDKMDSAAKALNETNDIGKIKEIAELIAVLSRALQEIQKL